MKKIKIIPLQKSINAEIEIPGSKSYTNRALLLAALTKNPVKIINPLFSDDTITMIDCLKELGIKIKFGKNFINVIGSISDIKNKDYLLNAKLSGTTIRFLLALSCIIPGIKNLNCEGGLRKRPIKELIEALRELGAEIEYLENEGYPPLKINSSELKQNKATINGEISSQFISTLLMIGPKIGGLELTIAGNLISKSYVDMTVDVMEKFGIKVKNLSYKKFIINPKQEYNCKEYLVEGDFSSATYFFALAALTKSELTLKNLNSKSKQADLKFLNILEKMGNEIIYGDDEIMVNGKGVKAVKVDMQSFPDSAQTLAILAAFAKGVTKISGVKSLRVKETERVRALENELGKMGIKTSSTEDSLTIYGGDPKPAEIETYGDHRMAMSFATIGTKLPGMVINNPEVVTKTFPEFWEKLESIGVKYEPSLHSKKRSFRFLSKDNEEV